MFCFYPKYSANFLKVYEIQGETAEQSLSVLLADLILSCGSKRSCTDEPMYLIIAL